MRKDFSRIKVYPTPPQNVRTHKWKPAFIVCYSTHKLITKCSFSFLFGGESSHVWYRQRIARRRCRSKPTQCVAFYHRFISWRQSKQLYCLTITASPYFGTSHDTEQQFRRSRHPQTDIEQHGIRRKKSLKKTTKALVLKMNVGLNKRWFLSFSTKAPACQNFCNVSEQLDNGLLCNSKSCLKSHLFPPTHYRKTSSALCLIVTNIDSYQKHTLETIGERMIRTSFNIFRLELMEIRQRCVRNVVESKLHNSIVGRSLKILFSALLHIS